MSSTTYLFILLVLLLKQTSSISANLNSLLDFFKNSTSFAIVDAVGFSESNISTAFVNCFLATVGVEL